MRKKITIIVLLVLSVLLLFSLGGYLAREQLFDWLIERNLRRPDRSLLDDHRLHVVLCGTGTPIGDPERAGSCTAVMAGGQLVFIDVGPGAVARAEQYRLPLSELSAVLVTHLHADHINGLAEAIVQSWIWGRSRPLAVYGPAGIQEVVDGLRQSLAADARFRLAHLGPEVLSPAGAQVQAHTISVSDQRAALVFEQGGVRATAFTVDHAPVVPALGYRLAYRGRTVVISGDTKKCSRVAQQARGADLLIHEALQKQILTRAARLLEERGQTRLAQQARHVLDYHTSPVEAAQIAQHAGVKRLVLTHIAPPLHSFLARWAFLQGVEEQYDGEVIIGEDGMRFDLDP